MPAVSLVKFLDREGTVCYPLTHKTSRNSAHAVCPPLPSAFANVPEGKGEAVSGLALKFVKHRGQGLNISMLQNVC